MRVLNITGAGFIIIGGLALLIRVGLGLYGFPLLGLAAANTSNIVEAIIIGIVTYPSILIGFTTFSLNNTARYYSGMIVRDLVDSYIRSAQVIIFIVVSLTIFWVCLAVLYILPENTRLCGLQHLITDLLLVGTSIVFGLSLLLVGRALRVNDIRSVAEEMVTKAYSAFSAGDQNDFRLRLSLLTDFAQDTILRAPGDVVRDKEVLKTLGVFYKSLIEGTGNDKKKTTTSPILDLVYTEVKRITKLASIRGNYEVFIRFNSLITYYLWRRMINSDLRGE